MITTFIAFGLLLSMLVITGLLFFWIYSTTLLPVFYHHGGPYVPTKMPIVEQMVRLAEIKPGMRVADLGSGDGRLVFAALKAGADQAVGYEINPWLVWRSRQTARRLGLQNRATFIRRSMFEAEVKDLNIIFLYQLPNTMLLLNDKLWRELPPGARVVSNGFKFKDWAPIKEEGPVRVYAK